ncbi:MAG TPA: hypothetical protein VNG13_03350 [Mycobacteriales bacterium]|nr:hypothetical protein [Mycobacteriales bacterium]
MPTPVLPSGGDWVDPSAQMDGRCVEIVVVDDDGRAPFRSDRIEIQPGGGVITQVECPFGRGEAAEQVGVALRSV